MMIELQELSLKELQALALLADKIWKAYYVSIISMEQIEYMLKKFYSEESLISQIENGQKFYLIKTDDKVAGFVSVSEQSKNQFFIHKFYIDTETQGKSIGSEVMQLLNEDIFRSKSSGNFEIRLTVNRQNFKAINFYFKNGFRIEKVEDFDIGNGYLMNDFVMIKKSSLV